MSYETKYHPDLCKNYPVPGKTKKTAGVLKWLCVLTALLLGVSLHKKGFWFDFLIPGDSAVTVAAVETLSEDLKDGIPFKTALQNFCIEIVADE